MTTSPFKFLDSYTREDIGSFFGRERGDGTLMTLIFMICTDEPRRSLFMPLCSETLSDPRTSAFIRAISVPS